MIFNSILDYMVTIKNLFPAIDAVDNFNFYTDMDIFSKDYSDSKPYNYSRSIINKVGVGNIPKRYVTGFTDGEGSFGINTTSSGVNKIKVSLQYKVTQLKSSEEVLHGLVDYFGVGKVHIDNASTNTLKYQVQDLLSIKDKILPHFSELAKD